MDRYRALSQAPQNWRVIRYSEYLPKPWVCIRTFYQKPGDQHRSRARLPSGCLPKSVWPWFLHQGSFDPVVSHSAVCTFSVLGIKLWNLNIILGEWRFYFLDSLTFKGWTSKDYGYPSFWVYNHGYSSLFSRHSYPPPYFISSVSLDIHDHSWISTIYETISHEHVGRNVIHGYENVKLF